MPKLHPLLLLPQLLMLMPALNLGTMDITAIPTDGAVTTEDIMLRIPLQILVEEIC